MKVIIAGSRSFDNYVLLSSVCDNVIPKGLHYIEIISGTSKGADKLGENYAWERNYGLKKFPADWDKNGKAAGYIRNEEMAKYADALIAFWDGESKGTKHMINLAKKHRLLIYIHKHN